MEIKNECDRHMKRTLKFYTKLGKFLPGNASKNQAVVEIEENCDVEWYSHHPRGESYKDPIRLR
ncbi:MAG: hypothetical protein CMF69_09820 [Magnetovibrio sp.]|nr:hypothetical protein [Magnetovibrio sp.]